LYSLQGAKVESRSDDTQLGTNTGPEMSSFTDIPLSEKMIIVVTSRQVWRLPLGARRGFDGIGKFQEV
jgi:hypothetical protein